MRAQLVVFCGLPGVGKTVLSRAVADQLSSGRSVVADAVNNVGIARRGWQLVARDCGVPLHFVEVTCSDEAEHRRRVESRAAEMRGHEVPTWEQVRGRTWEPFGDPRLTVDNLGAPDEHVAEVLAWLRAC